MGGERLVIEGDIVVGGETRIDISYMEIIGAFYDVTPVGSASVWIESSDGVRYTAVWQGSDKRPYYLIDSEKLLMDKSYKLCVRLVDNDKLYESDFLMPLDTPEIDTIFFQVNDDRSAVDFYVSSSGDKKASPYYKWSYDEDWEISASKTSRIYYDPGLNAIREYPVELYNYYRYCWVKNPSSSILIARTDNLSENKVSQQPLTTIADTDRRISILYSMNLRQMSISREAYYYWSVLKKNTDDIGGIFAPQPSEIQGNMHCVSDPDAKVIGYISAGTVSQQRIFVYAYQVPIFKEPDCTPEDPAGLVFMSLRDRYNAELRPVASNLSAARDWVRRPCVECTALGTKNKPAFWPNDHL